jgi:hypothetical protein
LQAVKHVGWQGNIAPQDGVEAIQRKVFQLVLPAP